MYKRIVLVTLVALGFGALLLIEHRHGTEERAQNVRPTLVGVSPDATSAKLPAPDATAESSSKPVKPSPPGNLLLAEKHKFRPPHPAEEPEFARFAAWAEKYLSADAATRVALEAEGIELAQVRRAAMTKMIRSNPERALELAVSYALRRALPQSVRQLLEEPVSGRGTMLVQAALPMPGKESEVAPNNWIAQFGAREYETF